MARPPLIKWCHLHREAKRVGLPNKEVTKSKNCPCCGESLNKTNHDFWVTNTYLGYLGCGIPLFFEFVKYGIQFLVLVFGIQGIYSLIDNKDGSYCEEYIRQQEDYCVDTFINTLCAENRKNLGISNGQSTCNILLINALKITTLVFRKHQNKISDEID